MNLLDQILYVIRKGIMSYPAENAIQKIYEAQGLHAYLWLALCSKNFREMI